MQAGNVVLFFNNCRSVKALSIVETVLANLRNNLLLRTVGDLSHSHLKAFIDLLLDTIIKKIFECENRNVSFGGHTKDIVPLGGRVWRAFVKQQARARVRACVLSTDCFAD